MKLLYFYFYFTTGPLNMLILGQGKSLYFENSNCELLYIHKRKPCICNFLHIIHATKSVYNEIVWDELKTVSIRSVLKEAKYIGALQSFFHGYMATNKCN